MRLDVWWQGIPRNVVKCHRAMQCYGQGIIKQRLHFGKTIWYSGRLVPMEYIRIPVTYRMQRIEIGYLIRYVIWQMKPDSLLPCIVWCRRNLSRSNNGIRVSIKWKSTEIGRIIYICRRSWVPCQERNYMHREIIFIDLKRNIRIGHMNPLQKRMRKNVPEWRWNGVCKIAWRRRNGLNMIR